MHPYINKQLIDDRHQRFLDEADVHRLVQPSRPRRRWFHRSRGLVVVPPEIEATTLSSPAIADDPSRPAA